MATTFCITFGGFCFVFASPWLIFGAIASSLPLLGLLPIAWNHVSSTCQQRQTIVGMRCGSRNQCTVSVPPCSLQFPWNFLCATMISEGEAETMPSPWSKYSMNEAQHVDSRFSVLAETLSPHFCFLYQQLSFCFSSSFFSPLPFPPFWFTSALYLLITRSCLLHSLSL